jgi:hypothetical protein
LVFAGLNSSSLAAQVTDPFFAQTHFAEWSAEPPVEQIPWKLRIGNTNLSTYQRISSHYLIDVDGRFFKHRTDSVDLVVMIQVRDSSGRIYQVHTVRSFDGAIPAQKKGAYFYWRAFILPGDYDIAVAMYDTSTGKHNFARQKLHVEPLNKDPLPEAWRDLPSLEFLQLSDKPPDSFYHPEVMGRLHLPLTPRRPVRVEILANLTGTGWSQVSHGAYGFNLVSLLPMVKAFSQMRIQGGTVNVELFDLIRRRNAFQQDNAGDLDWPRLKAAVTASDPTTVDVHALEDIPHSAAFLRKEVAARIQSGNAAPDAPVVLVLISTAALFDKLNDINDTILPGECNCAVYYIRYNPLNLTFHQLLPDFDNVKKVLKPLPIRTRVAKTPLDLRQIMAEIMDEIATI